MARGPFLALLLFLGGLPAHATVKADVATGYYALDVTKAGVSRNTNNLGLYRVGLRYNLLYNTEIGVSYSWVVANVISGDMGFGPDILLNFFPLTSAAGVRAESSDATIALNEHWKPYLGAGFHQRNYQSVQTSYSGISLALGTEYLYSDSYSLRAELRTMKLAGPSSVDAKELDVAVGVVIYL